LGEAADEMQPNGFAVSAAVPEWTKVDVLAERKKAGECLFWRVHLLPKALRLDSTLFTLYTPDFIEIR
jgi:hypothetical protein